MEKDELELEEMNKKEEASDYDNRSAKEESESEEEKESKVDEPLLAKKNQETVEKKAVRFERDYDRTADGDEAEVENLMASDTARDESETGQEPSDEEPRLEVITEQTQPQADEINLLRERGASYASKNWKKIGIIFYLIVFLSIIVPRLLLTVEYNKLVLLRNKITGRVDMDNTYGPGRHIVLPWKEPIFFKKDAHSYELRNLNVFTTDKMIVTLSAGLFYFLKKESLGKLYGNFGQDYESIIQRVTQSELMNHGLDFSLDEYRKNRTHIRKHLREVLKAKLEPNYHIRILDLYLSKITFSKEIDNLNLLRMTNGILNEKAAYDKQTNVTRAETELMVQMLKNQARFMTQSANDNATFTISKISETDKLARLEYVHLAGLNNSVRQLGLSDNKRALSYCYLNSLIDNERVKIVDFEQRLGANVGFIAFQDEL